MQLESDVKIFGVSITSVTPKAGEVIVPGDLVEYTESGWQKMNDDSDYADPEDVSVVNIGMAVEMSENIPAITMGGSKNDHIDGIMWGKMAIVRFGENWDAQGALPRAAEVLSRGDRLVIENGVLTKMSESSGTYFVVAEVLIGTPQTDGNVKITTTGYPQTITVS
jgi:hypothetical protein